MPWCGPSGWFDRAHPVIRPSQSTIGLHQVSAVLTVRLLIGLGMKVMLQRVLQTVLAANLLLTASNALPWPSRR
jgi:hypothetical protein